jgi:cytoskeletal protein CcmA (bactofilin family)
MADATREVAHIGKSVIIKGELSGSEDLYLDGEVEGSIELKGNRLTVGPNGKVRARVNAQGVVVEGKVDGNIAGTEKVELRPSAVVNGDISTRRIVVQEGAFLKGVVDSLSDGAK